MTRLPPSLMKSVQPKEWGNGRLYLPPQFSSLQPGYPLGMKADNGPQVLDKLLSMLKPPGKELFGWQGWLVDQLVRLKPDGQFASRNVAVCVPRQNGKGDVTEDRELLGALALGERHILHTAHNLETAESAFDRMMERVESNDYLLARLGNVSRSNGRKHITFNDLDGRTLGTIYYRTRSNKIGRGMQFQLVVMDEAMFVEQEHVASMLPTQAAQKNPQMVFTFTGLFDTSSFMHDIRRKHVDAGWGLVPGWSWVEWSMPEDGDWESDSQAVSVNPSTLDGLISLDTIQAERSSMGEAQFKRERLNVHEYTAEAASVIDHERLLSLVDPESQLGPRMVMGLHVERNLGHSWVAVAAYRPDGRMHMELCKSEPGTSWVVPWLEWARTEFNVQDPLYLSSNTASGTLLARLDKARIPWRSLSITDYIRAVNTFMDFYLDGVLVHTDQTELVQSLVGARFDDRGQGRFWSWKNSLGELGPTVAVTHAVFGALEVDSTPVPDVVWADPITAYDGGSAAMAESDYGGLGAW